MRTYIGIFGRDAVSNRATAKFTSETGTLKVASINLSSTVAAFTSNHATVTFENDDDLVSLSTFQGQIGIDTFELRFHNGVVIKGKLNIPGLEPAVSVGGTGIWESS